MTGGRCTECPCFARAEQRNRGAVGCAQGTARRAPTDQPLTLPPPSSLLPPHPSLLPPPSSLLTPHSSLLTPHPSPLTPHPSPLTPHPSLLTPHPSPLTPHSSPLTPHSSPLTPHSSPLYSTRTIPVGLKPRSAALPLRARGARALLRMRISRVSSRSLPPRPMPSIRTLRV